MPFELTRQDNVFILAMDEGDNRLNETSLGRLNELFDEGSVDFFSMSRPLISEPNLIARWQSNDRRKARCISCSKCIFSLLQGGIAKCYEFENKE